MHKWIEHHEKKKGVRLFGHMKKLKLFVSIFLIISTFLYVSISGAFLCPVFAEGSADTNIPNIDMSWTQTQNESQLVEAFRYYCKSRNLTIDGSIADAVTTFTTGAFNAICNSLGINITQLQSEIYYRTKDNIGLQYLFTNEGISFYNRIFAEFLQNNNLSVGDTVNDRPLYSGKQFTSSEGYSCLCFIGTGNVENSDGSGITYYGTYLKYKPSDYLYIYNNVSTKKYSIQFTSNLTSNGTVYMNNSGTSYGGFVYGSDPLTARFINLDKSKYDLEGYYSVFYNPNTDKYYPCSYYELYSGTYNGITAPRKTLNVSNYPLTISNGANGANAVVFITTNNNTINNNTYNDNDTTIINPDGNPDTPDPEPEPDPVQPESPATDWNINLPNFDGFNWSILGLQNKFPFCIPFDLVFLFLALEAEPVAPHIEGTVHFPLGDWVIDLDMSDYEDYAVIVRDFMFVLFIIGMLFGTRKLIRG